MTMTPEMNMTHDEFDAEVDVITHWLPTAADQLRQLTHMNPIRTWAEQLMHAIHILAMAGVHAHSARSYIGPLIENWDDILVEATAEGLTQAEAAADTAQFIAHWADVVVDRYNAMVIHRDLQSPDNHIAELARNWQRLQRPYRQHLIDWHPELIPADLILPRAVLLDVVEGAVPIDYTVPIYTVPIHVEPRATAPPRAVVRTLTYAPIDGEVDCPVCMDPIEGEAWQCVQCKHWVCKACMEHWTGSIERYLIPNNEGEEQLEWNIGVRHSTCPYCRTDI
jgi:hypothetical protein